jgi:hypothetical protein
LGGGRNQRLVVEQRDGAYAVQLPATAPGTLLPVVTLQFRETPRVDVTG